MSYRHDRPRPAAAVGGRFGNRLLQYAYGAIYARRTGAEYWLPSEWEGTRLFEAQPHAVVADEEIRRELALTDEWPAGDELRVPVLIAVLRRSSIRRTTCPACRGPVLQAAGHVSAPCAG